MDRHDFVENLIKERKSLEEEVDSLDVKISAAKRRTLDYLLEKFKKKEILKCSGNISDYNISGGGGCWVSQPSATIDEKLLITNEHITRLGADIERLKYEIIKKERDLEDLKGRDFISYIRENL